MGVVPGSGNQRLDCLTRGPESRGVWRGEGGPGKSLVSWARNPVGVCGPSLALKACKVVCSCGPPWGASRASLTQPRTAPRPGAPNLSAVALSFPRSRGPAPWSATALCEAPGPPGCTPRAPILPSHPRLAGKGIQAANAFPSPCGRCRSTALLSQQGHGDHPTLPPGSVSRVRDRATVIETGPCTLKKH